MCRLFTNRGSCRVNSVQFQQTYESCSLTNGFGLLCVQYLFSITQISSDPLHILEVLFMTLLYRFRWVSRLIGQFKYWITQTYMQREREKERNMTPNRHVLLHYLNCLSLKGIRWRGKGKVFFSFFFTRHLRTFVCRERKWPHQCQ